MKLSVVILVGQVCGLPYLISLKSNYTLDSFLSYDVKYPQSQQVKSLIDNSFTIGNFTGFAGDFTKSVIARLKKCPLVAGMTPDIAVRAYEIQYEAPRHLARISQRDTLAGFEYSYGYNDNATGKGVIAYVLDSGVSIEHPEFEGRAKFGKDFTGEGPGDNNGHGTHVSGLIGSKTYGVAKEVEIVEIKVLDKSGGGSLSTIISSLEFAVNHRIRSGKQGVVNMSLGSVRSDILNNAISAAIGTGLVFVVAAGNSNVNACSTSPASVEGAITVGAIDDFYDSLSPFSNWGKCVDIFASGTFVKSLNFHDFNNPEVLSGTSMSAPIVSGLVANLLSVGVPASEVKQILIELSTKGKISRTSLILKRNTPNRIAYNGFVPSEEESDDDSGFEDS